MKAAPFEYACAQSLEHACQLLAEHGDEAKLIAGGQSLVPMLAMRLLAPAVLIDIHRLAELQHISQDGDQLAIGAATRQCAADGFAWLDDTVPILRKALRWVGHLPTRNRGTVGGSLAHADPSAELTLVAALLEATLTLKSAQRTRHVAAADFFVGPMMTCLEPDECLIGVRFPIWRNGRNGQTRSGSAFDEIAARQGDFAIVSAAAQLGVDQAGVCTRAAVAIGGAGPSAMAFNDLAQRLVGSRLDDKLLYELAQEAAAKVEPTGDLLASVAYRRHLAGVLAERVLRAARHEAMQASQA
ncbi:MAG: carbon monoxide dehydrogenase medium chain [Herbaspirillum sp.]|jgi:CO/xanthine dehydrogenase FAD-binding subunit|nr:carbon monoxide dehydrogenase medium chain [Herbaspirillum sp.]